MSRNIEALIDERLSIDEQMELLNQRREEVNAAIAGLLPEGGQVGETKVAVTRARRLDTRALTKAYPVAKNPELYRPTLDTKAVRRHVAEVDLDGYMITGKTSVRLS